MDTFLGYPRPDGRCGIRNTVLVLSLVQCANSTVEKISAATGAPKILIDGGCGEFEDQAGRTNLGLIRAGGHPNVYGVLLVSLGCQWTDPGLIQREIEKTGARVFHLSIQEEGGMEAVIRLGTEKVRRMQAEAEAVPRVPCPLSGLVVSLNSGGSDWTSAAAANAVAGYAADRVISAGGAVLGGGVRGMPGDESYTVGLAKTHALGCQVLDMVEEYRRDLQAITGQKLSEVNPSPGNKEGGITTMAEKAMGNSKMQGVSPLSGLLETGQPVPGPGAWFLDERHGGNDTYLTTAMAMSGAHLMLFTTGRGTPQGNAVMPVLKITANGETDARLGREMIDFSAAGAVTGEQTVEEAGEALYRFILRVASGEATKAERFGDFSYLTPPATKIYDRVKGGGHGKIRVLLKLFSRPRGEALCATLSMALSAGIKKPCPASLCACGAGLFNRSCFIRAPLKISSPP